MSDLIDRQEAIEAASVGCQEWRGIFERVEQRISEIPSAQQWIPVTERLPERNKEVLITAWKDTVLIAWIDDDDTWSCDDFFFDDKTKVSAWMPLPEPYRLEGGATDV